MKISYQWLQTHIEEPLPPVAQLIEGITFHAFEVESVTSVENDTVFEVKVLPDRAHDCLSHRGIAKEVAAIFNLSVKPIPPKEILKTPLLYPIEIQSPVCRRYIAAVIRDVTVGPSPQWLSDALSTIGQRSVNNVVDATNYILFNLGCPVHAFDIVKIEKGIVVRTARSGEKIKVLSGEEKELSEEMLVIADYLAPIAIAGVKGGTTAEVTTETKDILIEVANFEPTSIRKTARRLNLLTDAAKRFENDITPAVTDVAFEEITSLILSVAGGSLEGAFDHYPAPATAWQVVAPLEKIKKLLGEQVRMENVVNTYDRYHYNYSVADEVITITPPLDRLDLQAPHDVAEDVGRMMGYEQVLEKLPEPRLTPVVNQTLARMQHIRMQLIKEGYHEVMGYSFCKKGEVYISYAPKDKAALRTNLLEDLRKSFLLNKGSAPLLGIKELKIFEIGTVFFENTEKIHVAMIDEAGEKEMTLEEFLPDVPEKYPALPFSGLKGKKFKPWSLYPLMVRDIAVWLPAGDSVSAGELQKVLVSFAQEHATAGPYLFDTFTKEENTSYGYRFVFQSMDKTLTDQEVNEKMEVLYKMLKNNDKFQLR